MRKVYIQLNLVVCLGIIFCGVGLLFTGSLPRPLYLDEATSVYGGDPALDLTYANCIAPSLDCSFIRCNANNQCPQNMAVVYQYFQNYPSGTQAGKTWKNTNPAQYQCNYHRACANPCSQSTIDNNWYCAGPVGPNINDAPVNGVTGGQKADKET